jgi:hypothetical protein
MSYTEAINILNERRNGVNERRNGADMPQHVILQALELTGDLGPYTEPKKQAPVSPYLSESGYV